MNKIQIKKRYSFSLKEYGFGILVCFDMDDVNVDLTQSTGKSLVLGELLQKIEKQTVMDKS